MTPPSENTWDRWIFDIDKSLAAIRAAGHEMIAVARMSSAPDGFRSGGGDGRSSGIANPTYNAATQEPIDDDVAAWIEDAFALIRCSVSDLKLAARRVALFNKRGDLRTNTSAADYCLACGRVVTGATDDKLRGGHCNACYTDHQRWKQIAPDPTALPIFRWRRWTKACNDLGQEPSQSEWKAWQDGETGPPKLTWKRETV